MELTSVVADKVDILKLAGRFDAFEVPAVIGWFDAHVSPERRRVIVDLSGVNFIDSAALACLLRGMKRCREHGGDLYLSNLMQPVTIIFELTRLDRAFSIFKNEAEAVTGFAEAKP